MAVWESCYSQHSEAKTTPQLRQLRTWLPTTLFQSSNPANLRGQMVLFKGRICYHVSQSCGYLWGLLPLTCPHFLYPCNCEKLINWGDLENSWAFTPREFWCSWTPPEPYFLSIYLSLHHNSLYEIGPGNDRSCYFNSYFQTWRQGKIIQKISVLFFYIGKNLESN